MHKQIGIQLETQGDSMQVSGVFSQYNSFLNSVRLQGHQVFPPCVSPEIAFSQKVQFIGLTSSVPFLCAWSVVLPVVQCPRQVFIHVVWVSSLWWGDKSCSYPFMGRHPDFLFVLVLFLTISAENFTLGSYMSC